MAASRNPSLLGMIGEAGLAMRRADREARQDALKEREVDIMERYRRAEEELKRAELDFQRDPTNPLNVARLAQAQYYMAAVRNAGSNSDGTFVPGVDASGRTVFFSPRTGRAVAAPEGFLPTGSAANSPEAQLERVREHGFVTAINNFLNNPAWYGLSEEERNARIREAERIFGIPNRNNRYPIIRGQVPGQSENTRNNQPTITIPYNRPMPDR
jgi:hypothetical protein